MSGAAAPIDTFALAALSERLGISPRQLLIAAARLAEADVGQEHDSATLQRILDDARRDEATTNASAQLLLTPAANYAIDDLDRLFATIWLTAGAKHGG